MVITHNKTELLAFLTGVVDACDYPNEKEVYITSGNFNFSIVAKIIIINFFFLFIGKTCY